MRTATRWLALVGMLIVMQGVPTLSKPARGGASMAPKAHGPKTATLNATRTGAPVKSSTTKVKGSSTAPRTTGNAKGATTKLAKSTAPKGSSAASKPKGGATTPTSTQSVSTKTASNTTTSSSGTASTPGTWTPNNAVAEKLSTKGQILTKVQRVIGTDVDLNNATAGFKNFGQFVAAVNVSNNHNIEFADLKAAMTGINIAGEPVSTTGTTTLSLGQAIQKLKTGVDADVVAQNALTQANVEINRAPTTNSNTSSAPSTSTSTTTTKAKAKSH